MLTDSVQDNNANINSVLGVNTRQIADSSKHNEEGTCAREQTTAIRRLSSSAMQQCTEGQYDQEGNRDSESGSIEGSLPCTQP